VPNELRNAELITVQLGLQWTCSRSFIMLNIIMGLRYVT